MPRTVILTRPLATQVSFCQESPQTTKPSTGTSKGKDTNNGYRRYIFLWTTVNHLKSDKTFQWTSPKQLLCCTDSCHCYVCVVLAEMNLSDVQAAQNRVEQNRKQIIKAKIYIIHQPDFNLKKEGQSHHTNHTHDKSSKLLFITFLHFFLLLTSTVYVGGKQSGWHA